MDTTSVKGVELRTDGDMVVLSHNRNGDFEKETFDSLKRMIEFISRSTKAPTFIDVGAYTGIYSIFAAKLGCDVKSFEPNPKVYTRFVQNVNYNYVEMGGWSGVIHYHRCALSDDIGAAYFNVNPSVELTSGGSLESTVLRNKEKYRVEINTYDNNDYPSKPDIIKIDVEGHEMAVLRGMKETLISTKAFVIVEANTEKAKTELIEFFSDIGYLYQGVFDDRNLIFSPLFNK